PSRLARHIPLDLETICLKCLQKEPEQRYPSAAALADDLRRFLDGEPIHARPIGVFERLRRWRRRKPALAALAALLLFVVVASLLGLTGLWLHSEGLRGQAEERRRQAEEALQREAVEHAQRQQQIARFHAANGAAHLAAGDTAAALPLYVEAQRLDQLGFVHHPETGDRQDQLHRLRLEGLLDATPRLVQMSFQPARIRTTR